MMYQIKSLCTIGGGIFTLSDGIGVGALYGGNSIVSSFINQSALRN